MYGWFKFNKSKKNRTMRKKDRPYNYKTIILFPSNLRHSIEKNLSNKIRYSIAFNTLPLGEIGTGDSKINFK